MRAMAEPVADIAPFLSNLPQPVNKHHLQCFVDHLRVFIGKFVVHNRVSSVNKLPLLPLPTTKTKRHIRHKTET